MKQAGMLELPVLGLLKEREMHGYELRKQLGAMLGPFWQVSWGSLYPTLRRLARAGAVEKLETEQSKPRRTRSTRAKGARAASRAARATTKTTLTTGRRKNVYRITLAGDQLFTTLLEETAAAVDAEHFTLKLAFFRYLKPEMRLALLERRRAYLMQKLNEFRENLKQYRERMDSYALSLQNHDMATTESDIAFIDELINRERTVELPRPNTSQV
ncbi:MAG: PadR family transcriptional regulator [Actinobacteria bacterium]|nr:PadR family transcriptional regulator [Actinomycetota bacterium]